jgi:hypothetical protein
MEGKKTLSGEVPLMGSNLSADSSAFYVNKFNLSTSRKLPHIAYKIKQENRLEILGGINAEVGIVTLKFSHVTLKRCKK